MPLAILCPGQGSQHAGMFENLLDDPRARPILEKISTLTRLDLRNLKQAENSGVLAQNRIAQVLVVGHSLALRAATSHVPDAELIVAGYSVGDLTAHAVAGAISVDDALSLADARGRAMDRAAQAGGAPLGMMGVRGLSAAAMERLIPASGAQIALVNGRDHFVVGGPVVGLNLIEERALTAGAYVRRLSVTVASHTFYLKAAADEFVEVLRGCDWKRPSHRLLSPIDGSAVTTKDKAIECLARQIHVCLDWESTMQSLAEYGASATIELGAGHALSAMIGESIPAITARAAEEFKTVAGLSQWIARHSGGMN